MAITDNGPRRRVARPFGQVRVIFENPGIGGGDVAAGLLEPVERLRCRADLVVVPAIGECRDLVHIGCLPLAHWAPPAPV